jgi:predicted Zn-dependent protease with MMP-like domain
VVPRVSEDRFRLLVLASLDGLPEWTRDALECLDVAVDDEPPETEPPETMGLYEGIPVPERDGEEDCEPHDRTRLFAGPIEREADAKHQELGLTVARVVRHELAHYFGIDDEELMDLGAY